MDREPTRRPGAEVRPGPSPRVRPRVRIAARVLGVLLAVVAIALCVRTLVRSWDDVHSTVSAASPGWILTGVVLAALAMVALALMWWRCLDAFGVRTPPARATAWYFGAELGKYLPGGVWTTLGRGELAGRGGVPRGVTYVTTVLSYAGMCVAAAATTGVLAPVAVLAGAAPRWFLVATLLLPAAAVMTRPVSAEAAITVARRIGRERVALPTPPWPALARVVAVGVLAWLLYGAAAAALAQAVDADGAPVRLAVAAVVAWTVGFVLVPVPAGAGVRELVFVALAGLPAPSGVVVAVLLRLVLIVVDAVGGVLGLLGSARRRAAVPG